MAQPDPSPPPSSPPAGPGDPLRALRAATVADLARGFGLPRVPGLAALGRALAGRITHPLVQATLDYDAATSIHGLAPASRRFAGRIGAELRSDLLPPALQRGPLLIAANHPGLADTVALFAALGREDLRIVADPNPFLLALPNLRKRLFLLPERPAELRPWLRTVLIHLAGGGALLLFPAGRIEPDPEFRLDEARQSLAEWSDSLALLARATPGLHLLPAAVSGVINPRAQAHRLTHLRRSREGREQIGAFLQLLLPGLREKAVVVAFGEPFTTDSLPPGRRIIEEMRARMDSLLERASAGRVEPVPAGQPVVADSTENRARTSRLGV